MTGQEAVAYIDTFQWQAHAPGLERIRTLLHALGDPQKELKFVHVAGTNGKGSVCAYLASVLRCAGYRVGLCTSPFLEDFRERIQVDGELIPPEVLGELTELARPAAEAMEDHPTEFELITAVAMLYFRPLPLRYRGAGGGPGRRPGRLQRHRCAGGGGDHRHGHGPRRYPGPHPGGYRRSKRGSSSLAGLW